MQPELTTIANENTPNVSHENNAPTKLEIAATAPGQYRVIRRNGKVTTFDREKIKVAVTKAFLCLLYTSPSPRDQRGSRMPSSA